MSTIFETNNAFKMYLGNLAPEEGAKHIIECLRARDQGDMAWDLMEEYFGENWKCPPNHLPSLALAVSYILKAKIEEAQDD
jgi:hypothetical protein